MSKTSSSDKACVLAAVKMSGYCLKYASQQFRKDKEVVIAAVRKTPQALKFALDGLNQDSDCLKESGLWDLAPENVSYARDEHTILSMKFSLTEKSTEYATSFALAMKEDKYFKDFKTYNPHVWEKDSCDPSFTDFNHMCRGTPDTCGFGESRDLTVAGRPTRDSCWRCAFRFHLEECKAKGGFMIQVEESNGLGRGQEIETEMAKQVGLKVFRTTDNCPEFRSNTKLWKVAKAVQRWFESGCKNMDLEIIDISARASGRDSESVVDAPWAFHQRADPEKPGDFCRVKLQSQLPIKLRVLNAAPVPLLLKGAANLLS